MHRGGLRIAYLVAPDQRQLWPVSAILRTASVMASPLTTALSTQWIEDGTARQVVQALRRECAARRGWWRKFCLPVPMLPIQKGSICRWRCPNHGSVRLSRRGCGPLTGVVVSDAFTVGDTPVEAVRISLGGVLSRAELSTALQFVTHVLEHETQGGADFA
jgi:DNA-binding transcriptional MocR family regulator